MFEHKLPNSTESETIVKYWRVLRSPNRLLLQLALKNSLTPTYCITPESSTKVIYEKMGGRDKDIRPFYPPCITPLQINMMAQLPPKLKSLIRLVKYWKKETFVDRATRWPTSYVMELVVLHAWTKAGERSDFDMVRGLHAVLTSLVNHKQFRILLDERITYDKKFRPKLEETFIIDPCNPYNDVYDGWAWGNVSALAREWLKKPLFAGVSETSKRW